MKKIDDLINSSAEWLSTSNPFQLIEYVSRLCHKSEDSMSDTSCYSFVNKLIQDEHYAMLEHAVLHFKVSIHGSDPNIAKMLLNIPKVVAHEYRGDWVITVSMSHLFNPEWNTQLFEVFKDILVNTYELWQYPEYGFEHPESGRLVSPFLFSVSDECELEVIPLTDDDIRDYPFYKQHIHKTCKFICDRGVSHEIVRHRASFAQESTRYCNYSTDKFDHSISYIRPSTWDEWDDMCKCQFMDHISASETIYNYLSYRNLLPQQARTTLPNALKTELVMTASMHQWDHFFNLRYHGTTGEPHPDMKRVAGIAYKTYSE